MSNKTIGDYLKEAELYEYSREYFEICKTVSEIRLLELYIENQEYINDEDNKVLIESVDTDYLVEADDTDKVEEAKDKVEEKKNWLWEKLSNLYDWIKRMILGFFGWVGKQYENLKKKAIEFYEYITGKKKDNESKEDNNDKENNEDNNDKENNEELSSRTDLVIHPDQVKKNNELEAYKKRTDVKASKKKINKHRFIIGSSENAIYQAMIRYINDIMKDSPVQITKPSIENMCKAISKGNIEKLFTHDFIGKISSNYCPNAVSYNQIDFLWITIDSLRGIDYHRSSNMKDGICLKFLDEKRFKTIEDLIERYQKRIEEDIEHNKKARGGCLKLMKGMSGSRKEKAEFLNSRTHRPSYNAFREFMAELPKIIADTIKIHRDFITLLSRIFTSVKEYYSNER